jgi:hypothetical protein
MPAPPFNARLPAALLIAALALLVLRLQAVPNIDPDLFHELCLAREAVALGRVPTEDVFAYTPTVTPVVHHEWGFGLVMYGVTRATGDFGLVGARFVLAVVGVVFLALIARRHRFPLPLFVATFVLVALPFSVGITTVRAQLLTVALTAFLLFMLDRYRASPRLLLFLPV